MFLWTNDAKGLNLLVLYNFLQYLGGYPLSEILIGTNVSTHVEINKYILDFLIGIIKPNCYFSKGIKI